MRGKSTTHNFLPPSTLHPNSHKRIPPTPTNPAHTRSTAPEFAYVCVAVCVWHASVLALLLLLALLLVVLLALPLAVLLLLTGAGALGLAGTLLLGGRLLGATIQLGELRLDFGFAALSLLNHALLFLLVLVEFLLELHEEGGGLLNRHGDLQPEFLEHGEGADVVLDALLLLVLAAGTLLLPLGLGRRKGPLVVAVLLGLEHLGDALGECLLLGLVLALVGRLVLLVLLHEFLEVGHGLLDLEHLGAQGQLVLLLELALQTHPLLLLLTLLLLDAGLLGTGLTHLGLLGLELPHLGVHLVADAVLVCDVFLYLVVELGALVEELLQIGYLVTAVVDEFLEVFVLPASGLPGGVEVGTDLEQSVAEGRLVVAAVERALHAIVLGELRLVLLEFLDLLHELLLLLERHGGRVHLVLDLGDSVVDLLFVLVADLALHVLDLATHLLGVLLFLGDLVECALALLLEFVDVRLEVVESGAHLLALALEVLLARRTLRYQPLHFAHFALEFVDGLLLDLNLVLVLLVVRTGRHVLAHPTAATTAPRTLPPLLTLGLGRRHLASFLSGVCLSALAACRVRSWRENHKGGTSLGTSSPGNTWLVNQGRQGVGRKMDERNEV
mmetsp:Transcript_24433/g.60324  ORF Transcript_24433/g.60324 Transcript_24433/m.60324 type:complete len:614 (-) Transcript_24433:71-1912(-)